MLKRVIILVSLDRNFAFVEFRSEGAAEKAKKELNGGSIDGKPIKVRYEYKW